MINNLVDVDVSTLLQPLTAGLPGTRNNSPGARGSYPALRVKVFFFADSGSPKGSLQFLGG